MPLAFILTGQGAQWPGMGKDLMESFPLYRQTIENLDESLSGLKHPPDWKLADILNDSSENSRVGTASQAQPACTALQIALIELLRSWGVSPEVAVGHSSGEIAAAYACGHISASEAITIAYYRGMVVSQGKREGAMAAVGINRASILDEISKLQLEGKIRVACVNSPESITLSGDVDAVDNIVVAMQAKGKMARKLRTDNKAYHSYHTVALGQKYEDLLNEAQIGASNEVVSSSSLISTVTGLVVDADTTRRAAYWRQNLESTVLFQEALETATAVCQYQFVEIGPHSALHLPLKQTLEALSSATGPLQYSSALIRNKSGIDTMLSLAGDLFLSGVDINFDKVNLVSNSASLKEGVIKGSVVTNLPPYKWHHETLLWSESRMVSELRNRKYSKHELLGAQVTGTNSEVIMWKNMLGVKDLPWLQDHKIATTIVFPATGYIAIACEAFRQTQGLTNQASAAITLRQIRFLKPLAFSEVSKKTEVFTTLLPRRLIGTSKSKMWWEFEISSFLGNAWTIHSTGSIGFDYESVAIQASSRRIDSGTAEEQAPRTWYKRFAAEDLNFGTAFQSMKHIYAPRQRNCFRASSRTSSLAEPGSASKNGYFIHPITMDAMLQTAFVASAAGKVEDLRSKLPTFIEEVKLFPMENSAAPGELNDIFASTDTVGIGSVSVSADLCRSDGVIIAQLSNVYVRLYQDSLSVGKNRNVPERATMLQLIWKPDITSFSPGYNAIFNSYAESFGSSSGKKTADKHLKQIATALDLITHHNQACKILEFGNHDMDITESLLDLLQAGSLQQRVVSFFSGDFNELGSLHIERLDSKEEEPSVVSANGTLFNIIVVPQSQTSDWSTLTAYLAPNGWFIFRNDAATNPGLDSTEFIQISTSNELASGVTIARHQAVKPSTNDTGRISEIFLIYRNTMEKFEAGLAECLGNSGYNVTSLALDMISKEVLPSNAIFVSTIELYQACFAALTDKELVHLQNIFNRTSTLLWMTGGGLFEAKRPDFATAFGCLRSLPLEQPSLIPFILDIDPISHELDSAKINVSKVLYHALQGGTRKDTEFYQYNGILYVSRFHPEKAMNTRFHCAQLKREESTQLSNAGRCSLSITIPDQFDTLQFIADDTKMSPLPPKSVLIRASCFSINAKDVYVLSNRVTTKNAAVSGELTGEVIEIGADVTRFKPGDRVVALYPGHFGTYEIVPERTCFALNEGESDAAFSTIPVAYITALHSLRDLGQLRRNQSVLIHSASGGVGIAAIQIAQHIGAEIYATVGSQRKKEFLVQSFGVDPARIFNSRDTSFFPAVQQATNGKGVDVVLNSLTGDLLHASWRACAPFGRFVEIGKQDINNAGRLDMDVFERSVTFAAFDLARFFDSEEPWLQDNLHKLFRDVLDLIRSDIVKIIQPIKIFDVSEIDQAFRYFSQGSRIGKVVVSMQSRSSLIPFVPHKYNTLYDPSKYYLMVGCLGGLGRSLSRKLLAQGARKFIFFGPSGQEKASAKGLVEDFLAHGAEVQVVTGDVVDYTSVERTIAGISGEIGGVVLAVMRLEERLFANMSSKSWHYTIDPKIQGSWNIHNALLKHNKSVGFFMLLSSITGSIGTATESNYCAANSFQDSFARYRRSLGLPAIALGLGMISEVGYLDEHPDIEKVLLRKGLYPITEVEFLQICDISLDSSLKKHVEGGGELLANEYGTFADAHILTGLETAGLQTIRDQGFDGTHSLFDDPRASFVFREIMASSNSSDNAYEHGDGEQLPSQIGASLQKLRKSIAKNDDAAIQGLRIALNETIEFALSQKLRNLLLLETDDLSPTTPFSVFGFNSMLASDLRHYLFHTLTVDVPFMMLLEGTTTVQSLSKVISHELMASNGVTT